MPLLRILPLATLLLAVLVNHGAVAQSPNSLADPLKPGASVAFFGLTFIDTSTEGAYNGARADQTQRLELLNRQVRERFAAEGFNLLPLTAVAAQLAATSNPADCYGCEVRMAQTLAADYALVGEVQKVSNLILSMNLVMRDATSGKMVRGMSVDIRSNTDQSWLRGLSYIFRHHFFRETNR